MPTRNWAQTGSTTSSTQSLGYIDISPFRHALLLTPNDAFTGQPGAVRDHEEARKGQSAPFILPSPFLFFRHRRLSDVLRNSTRRSSRRTTSSTRRSASSRCSSPLRRRRCALSSSLSAPFPSPRRSGSTLRSRAFLHYLPFPLTLLILPSSSTAGQARAPRPVQSSRGHEHNRTSRRRP